MKIRYIFPAILLCSTLSLATAHPGNCRGKGPYSEQSIENRVEKLQKNLNLSDEQAEQIRSIMEAGRLERNNVIASYGVDLADRDSRKNLDPQVKKQMREELKQLRKNHRNQIQAVLTEEQLKEWKLIKEKKRAKKKGKGKK